MRCAYHYGWTLVLDVLFFPANRNVVLMQDLESRLTKTPFLAPLLRVCLLACWCGSIFLVGWGWGCGRSLQQLVVLIMES